ncbi:GNAT family N-acetyltransferase [Aquimarina algiphila]|uniref:GNAT family N-acetyltransferase n=1 Tax=Aquimarina algiphila TaxID=2047982 RepID=UPI0024932EC9|nr:GNAT family N-acetyltransferase [Aquimarina algiphila]
MKDFLVKKECPKPSAYIKIRKECDFGEVSPKQSETCLDNSLFFACIYESKELVGFGRIVGDGVLCFYIADVLVSPKMAGQGVGGMIIAALVSYLKEAATPLSTITLLAAPNKESFYSKYGFETCPNKYFGKGMSYIKWINL